MRPARAEQRPRDSPRHPPHHVSSIDSLPAASKDDINLRGVCGNAEHTGRIPTGEAGQGRAGRSFRLCHSHATPRHATERPRSTVLYRGSSMAPVAPVWLQWPVLPDGGFLSHSRSRAQVRGRETKARRLVTLPVAPVVPGGSLSDAGEVQREIADTWR